jgi:hypothetical protein
MIEKSTYDRALDISCPRCFAKPGEKCVLMFKSWLYEPLHLERYQALRETEELNSHSEKSQAGPREPDAPAERTASPYEAYNERVDNALRAGREALDRAAAERTEPQSEAYFYIMDGARKVPLSWWQAAHMLREAGFDVYVQPGFARTSPPASPNVTREEVKPPPFDFDVPDTGE